MTAHDQNIIRPNGTYDLSAAMDRAARQQRRASYVAGRSMIKALGRASRGLWSFASQMAAPNEHLKTRMR